MVNIPRVYCIECHGPMIRARAQSSTADIPLGYYCPVCKIMIDNEGYPMISYKAVFHIEPEPRLGIIRDVFKKHWEKVIEKIQADPNVRTLPKEIRYPDNAIEKHFDNQVRQQEIKEAAEHQEFIK